MTEQDENVPVRCSACKRALLERRVLGDAMVGGVASKITEYRVRPFAATVHSRMRPLPADYPSVPLHEWPADGPPLQVREFPVVCSRACLDAVRADASYELVTEANASLRFRVHRVTLREGDDHLGHILGAAGPLPESPSDEWLDPETRSQVSW